MLQFICLLFTMHTAAPDSMQTYKDSLGRYTVQYPATWHQTYADKATGFVSPQDGGDDLFLENVNVIVQDLSAYNLTLEDYTTLTKSQYTDAYGASSIKELKDTTFLGLPAKVGVFILKAQESQSIEARQYWFIKNKMAYLITYSAQPSQYARYMPVAMGVIRSFKLLK